MRGYWPVKLTTGFLCLPVAWFALGMGLGVLDNPHKAKRPATGNSGRSKECTIMGNCDRHAIIVRSMYALVKALILLVLLLVPMNAF